MDIRSAIANSNIGHKIYNFRNKQYYDYLWKHYNTDILSLSQIDYKQLKNSVLHYTNSLKEKNGEFRFAASSIEPCLYATVYGYLIYDLLDELTEGDEKWLKEYLDSFQIDNGLFYDKRNYTKLYDDGDGWGARHLALHIIILYESIKAEPNKSFSYLTPYHDQEYVNKWLHGLNWKNAWAASNSVMNIGCMLQYQRDFLHCNIGVGLDYIIEWLKTNMINRIPLWHEGRMNNESAVYDSIRAAYHLLPILIYEGFTFDNSKDAIKLILKSQNRWGGFDFSRISSACHDIDALDPLIRLSEKRDKKVEEALIRALNNILFNQNEDGGFVFSRDKNGFCYGGCDNLRSLPNESNLFGTWFRLVSVLEILDYFDIKKFSNHQVPGYEFEIKEK